MCNFLAAFDFQHYTEAELLIFIREINDSFQITEEFLIMESMKGRTRGEDLYHQVSAVIEVMKPVLTQDPETAPQELQL